MIARVMMPLSTAIVVGGLTTLLATITIKGIPAMSWEMISRPPEAGFYLGGGGGLLNAILGSLLVAGGATILAFLVGLPIAFYLQKGYVGGRRRAEWLRLFFDILNGIPSLLYGAFGFLIMIIFGLHASLLAGILAVALLELPLIVRGVDETLRMVPESIVESSLAVGATRIETMIRVGARQAAPGIVTAVLVAAGRGFGDAASVLFTAGFTDHLPTSLFEPVATLPLSVFFLLNTPLPETQARAHAAAFILLLIVSALSIGGRLLAARFARFTVK
jgi:phosphate transport system permease protein